MWHFSSLQRQPAPLPPAFAVPLSKSDTARRGVTFCVCASASTWLRCKLALLAGDWVGWGGIRHGLVQWKDGRGPFLSCCCHLFALGPLVSRTPPSWFVKKKGQLCQPHRIVKHACQVLAKPYGCKNAVVKSSVISISTKSVAFGGSRKQEAPACPSQAMFDVVTA